MSRFLFMLSVPLGVAAFFRFFHLADQSFFMFDEARYLLEAETLKEQWHWIASHGMASSGAPSIVEHARVEGMARPLHVMILAAAGSVPVALYCMAALGSLSTLLAYGIAERAAREDHGIAPRVTGAIAALLLALSPSHIFHSRTLLAEVDAVFFLLLAVWIYFGAHSLPAVFAGGVAFGLAVVTQSRIAMSLPLFIVWDLLRHRSPRRTVLLIVGVTVSVAGMEFFYQVLRLLLHSSGHPDSFMTYVEQFLHRGTVDSGHLAFNRPWFGLRYLFFTESFIVPICFLFGLIMALHRRLRHACLLGLYACFVLAVASLYDQDHHSGFRWGRAVAPAIPFVIISAALFIARAGRILPMSATVIGIVLTLVLQSRVETLVELAFMHSDQEQVLMTAVKNHPAKHYFSEEPLHVLYYLGPKKMPPAFIPRADTLTVVLFDPGYARNFGFAYYLPDTPASVISNRSHRPSRLMYAETVGREDLTLDAPVVPPAHIHVLPPVDTPAEKIRRIF